MQMKSRHLSEQVIESTMHSITVHLGSKLRDAVLEPAVFSKLAHHPTWKKLISHRQTNSLNLSLQDGYLSWADVLGLQKCPRIGMQGNAGVMHSGSGHALRCRSLLAIPVVGGLLATSLFLPTKDFELSVSSNVDNREASTVKCLDQRGQNQSCMFQRVYLCMLRHDMPALYLLGDRYNQTGFSLQMWGAWPEVGGQTHVMVRSFSSLQELDEACPRSYNSASDSGNQSIPYSRGLHLLYAMWWHHNWVHATLDGLWPAYVALGKFKKHMKNFTSIVFMANHSPSERQELKPEMERALRLFASWGSDEPMKVFPSCNYEKHLCEAMPRLLLVEELIVGSGTQSEFTSGFTLRSSVSLQHSGRNYAGLLKPFVERYLLSHGIRQGALEGVVTVSGAGNRRFDASFLKKFQHSLSMCADIPGTRCRLEEFRGTWLQTLKALSATKVLVTGLGTAMFNAIWLPDGSVTVNLGDMSQEAPGTLRGFPTYGEEFILASHTGMQVLYNPLAWIISKPTAEQMFHLIQEGVSLVRKGFAIPTKHEDQFSIFGKIVLDLAAKDRNFAKEIESSRTGSCRTVYPSEIVYESQMGQACNLSWTLLRELKVSYQLREELNVSHACDCVVCAACGLRP